MKTTNNNHLFAKIRLFLIILASCTIITCLFLIIIHPDVWVLPTCTMAVMLGILLYLLLAKRHKVR